MTTATAAAAANFLSIPNPHRLSVSKRGHNGKTLPFPKSSVRRHNNIPLSSSSSTSPAVVEEESASPPPPPPPPSDGLPMQSESTATTRGCKACGREEVENGCNGEGRIQGGIATVPGFGWWPIKAYRPCPGFVASGGRYRRRGQSMDDVVSGSGGKN